MTPLTSVLLGAWELRPEILLTLGLAAVLHLNGWRRLAQRTGGRFRAGARPAAYLGGLAVLALALMSPLDTLVGELFFMHMLQHLLIIAVAAPLLWLADPLPFSLWGMPAGLRREAGRLLGRDSTLRAILRRISSPGLVWLVFVVTLIGWHDPNMYDAALVYPAVHDLEHLTFFGAAMLFWWPAIGAAPKVRRLTRGTRLGLLLAAVPPMAITGMVIALSTNPIYPYYAARPRLWGMSVLDDQRLSGILMWIVGSMMYIVGALVLLWKMLGREESKQPLPEQAWAGDEAMLAPGIKARK